MNPGPYFHLKPPYVGLSYICWDRFPIDYHRFPLSLTSISCQSKIFKMVLTKFLLKTEVPAC